MLNSKYIRAAAVAFALAALLLSSGATFQKTEANLSQQTSSVIAEAFADDQERLEATPAEPDPLSSTSTFYTVRADLRRCVSPMCGGYFVKRVNMPLTRCPNGRDMAECYVAEIDWDSQPQVDAGLALLRGSVMPKTYPRFGNLGVLRITESWQAASNSRPAGTFYRVRDRGLRCITHPCPTHHEAKLNSTFSLNIAGVDLSGANLDTNSAAKVQAAMTGPDAAIIAGNSVPVSGPGGTLSELKATQVYFRNKTNVSNLKPCIKTGCSNQICSDQNVISTCEWRAEYACYQKAACERQADGNCGFTKTRELASCLARR